MENVHNDEWRSIYKKSLLTINHRNNNKDRKAQFLLHKFLNNPMFQ